MAGWRWCEQVRGGLGEVGRDGESLSKLWQRRSVSRFGQGAQGHLGLTDLHCTPGWSENKNRSPSVGELSPESLWSLVLDLPSGPSSCPACGLQIALFPKLTQGHSHVSRMLTVSVAAVGSPTSLKSKEDTVCVFLPPWKLVSWKSTQEQCRSFRTLATNW